MKYRITQLFVTFSMVFFTLFSALAETEQVTVQILATSDLHGRFVPYDYAINEIALEGSLAQIATEVQTLRKGQEGNTIVVDAGDFAQDNFQYLFVNKENPMIKAMNLIGYDMITLGNHEFNQGVSALKNMMSQFQDPERILCGNVYTRQNERLYALSTVVTTANDVTVGFIGTCTPNITRWDAEHLKEHIVTDPLKETRAAIEQLAPRVDVLVALLHMGEDNEYGVPNSGVADLAAGCPELDLIICGHAHQNIDDHYFFENKIYAAEEATETIRREGILIVMPYRWAAVLSQILITLTKDDGTFIIENKARDIIATNILMKTDERTIAADPVLLEELQPFHQVATESAVRLIGELTGGSLVPPEAIKGIPTARIQPTAMIQLINDAQTFYGKIVADGRQIDVSSAAAFRADANIPEGPIRYCDIALIYKYDNTLYVIEMTGAQLKKYMENTASYYNQYHPGDLTLSFNPDMWGYSYDMFNGINYKIDISEPAGNRIKDIRRPNGDLIADDEKLLVAVNNYRANVHLLTPDPIFQEGDSLPRLIGKASDYPELGDGRIRDLIARYIQEEKKGLITNETTNNWKITGNTWKPNYHKMAARAINDGLIQVGSPDYPSAIRPVTTEELINLHPPKL